MNIKQLFIVGVLLLGASQLDAKPRRAGRQNKREKPFKCSDKTKQLRTLRRYLQMGTITSAQREQLSQLEDGLRPNLPSNGRRSGPRYVQIS